MKEVFVYWSEEKQQMVQENLESEKIPPSINSSFEFLKHAIETKKSMMANNQGSMFKDERSDQFLRDTFKL